MKKGFVLWHYIRKPEFLHIINIKYVVDVIKMYQGWFIIIFFFIRSEWFPNADWQGINEFGIRMMVSTVMSELQLLQCQD